MEQSESTWVPDDGPIAIAVDAMGGDHAPEFPVEGAVCAARELGIAIRLVGQEEVVRQALKSHDIAGLDIEIVHAADIIAMDEPVVMALRKKKHSSLRVAAKLVREGSAGGMVSAGNTGAVMATAKIVMGTLLDVSRPALTTTVPNINGHTTWLDVGANVDVKPEVFREFAIMGSIYAQEIVGVRNPRVGLLSIGAEEIKGTNLTREVHRRLKQEIPNFIGNVEGRDLFNGRCDVVVCDGFTGNVSLKALEAIVETLDIFLRQEIEKRFLSKLGFFLCRPAFRGFKKKVDYAEMGGAPLLGLKGCAIVCHGGSSPRAIKNAVRVAEEFTRKRVNHRIAQRMRELRETSAVVTAKGEPAAGSRS